MIRRIFLPTILLVLAYGFWVSPDFKEISAGVAIFLFGMLALEEGFKAFTGGTLESILRKSTNRYWKSLSFGIASTTLMQSSSLVSVITISFLSAGLITLVAGIGIIFGANIGTTTGAWLIAGLGLKVKISAYAMPMLVFGVILVLQMSKYLNDAVLEFPDATMEAVRKETLHLYDNALEVLAHGVSLHRHEVFSDVDLEPMVVQRRRAIPIEIDAVYERNVKVLYGAIVAFISEAQTRITAEHSEDLYALRTAGRHIVEAVKDIKHLNKNLSVYVVSENEHIRGEYNQFRLQVGTILRELGGLREDALDPENIGLLNLDSMIAMVEEGDVVSNGSLDQLIRRGLITPEMATSVMNDSAYTYDVSMKLIEMGGILFAARAMELREVERAVILNEQELEEIMEEIAAEEVAEARPRHWRKHASFLRLVGRH